VTDFSLVSQGAWLGLARCCATNWSGSSLCYPQFIRLLMMGVLCKSASIPTSSSTHAHKCHEKRQQTCSPSEPKTQSQTVGVDTIFCKLYSIVWLSVFCLAWGGRGPKAARGLRGGSQIRPQVHDTQVPVASSELRAPSLQLPFSNSTPIYSQLLNLFVDNASDCSGSGALLWYVCPVLLGLHNV